MRSMNMNTIDWTNARLSAQDTSISPQLLSRFEERLSNDVAAGKLPFITYAHLESLQKTLPELVNNAPKVKHMILLGIGGSALGTRAIQKAFCPQHDWPSYDGPCLWIADNIDALALETWMNTLNPKETMVVTISKSGGTIESLSQHFILKDWLKKNLGSEWSRHMVIVTDANNGFLREEALQNTIATLPVPDYMGGRYSVFSGVGLLPALHLGLDWVSLVKGAKDALAPLVDSPSKLGEHPSFKIALWAHALMQKNYSELIFFSYVPAWNSLGQWFAQLWAESLGKEGKGSMPIPAVGVTDQHSTQQMFLDGQKNKGCLFITCENLPKGPSFPIAELPEKWSWLKGKQFGDLLTAEGIGSRMAMSVSEIPLVHLDVESTNEYNCGRLMGLCMAATMFTGWLMDINPLDQPAVELGKRLANAQLDAPGYDKETAELKKFLGASKKELLQGF